ncbi:hypothetical protein SAMN04488008_10783 [Maribacter orientalis]|uniref:Uncharacterized protein n=1 Tax=Maribacter orientalis TaxID=228957 RepID=A0A1H7UDM8_9FLAO|nr:hypothetical protein [Maribacter orientalis]SEL94929.1 hypothetical protein SAMN04488008_10783 [Maribacter orientalis]
MNIKVKNKKAQRKIFLESIMVFFIAVSPFLYKLYDYIPNASENSVSFLGITIGSHGFADVSTFIWFLMSKIVPLYLLIFWFLTVKNWWYHIILIPIAMYAFQIFEVLYSNDNDIDTENLLWLLPICIVIIPFVYFLRIKLYDKHVLGIDLDAMDKELKELKNKDFTSDGFTPFESRDTDEESEISSMSDELNTKLSTGNLEHTLKGFQERIQTWLNFKF